MKQKLLLLSLLTLLGSITANAASFVVDGIKYYTLTNNTVEVASQSPKYSGSVTIPATVTYNNVTYSVSRIGMNAFSGCTGLISIEIPNSVTRICDHAFWNCTGLESIEIPSSVKMIDDGAFVGCSNLSSIIVNSGNTMYESPSGCNAIIKTSTHELVAGCKNTIIPNSVTSIGKSAFSSCTGLASIEIPNSVTSIGDWAFFGCTSLTSIEIPDNVTSIGEYAFSQCSGLTSVLISDGVKSIGQFAFYNCSVLSSITIPNSVTSIGNQAFENTAWYNNQPDGLVYAGKVAYQYKGTMPDNTTIIIEDGTVSISNSAFYNCTGLFSVTIPNSVISIGVNAFGSTGLTSIEIGNNVECIGERAFYNCDGLTSINIPNSVTSLGNSAFSDCEHLSSVALGNGITVIPASAFDYCSSLTSIEIPNNVTSIGENAFSYCTNMLSVIIPRSVTTIGSNAFYNCTRLNSVVYEAEEPYVIYYYIPFYNIPSTCTLTVPYGKRDTYIAAGWTEDIFKGGVVEAPLEIVLTDGTTFQNDTEQNCETLSYTRTFNNTNWQALYVPFSMSYDDWKDDFDIGRIIAYYPYYDENGTMTNADLLMTYVTSGTLKPNHPYFIKAKTTGEKTISLTNATLYASEENSVDCSTVEAKCTFTGTYSPVQNSEYYVMGGGKLGSLGNGTLSAMRWYMTIENRGSQFITPPPSSISLRVVSEEDATAILQTINDQRASTVYDLYGRTYDKLPTQRGVYIINGKKVMIK